ncbi:MAG: tetratricopeptide repeat protein [Gammaproteobacteria bacterium]|nr:tetratricopeptide repeat protein [Gammaproteobacteria bacterium]MCW5582271.1 tetratricopeptide repeat protein [Gammaproteobacteria bacterium]
MQRKKIYFKQLDSDSVECYYERGLDYYHQGDFDSAVKVFTEALNLGFVTVPNYVKLYNARGMTYLCNPDTLEQASEDFRVAIKLDPNHAQAYGGRGLIYQIRKKYDKAIRDFIKALELYPQHEQVIGKLKRLLSTIQYDDLSGIAKSDLFEAIKKLPNKEEQISLLEQCLNKNTSLGKHMWEPKYAFSPCSLEKGTLKCIADYLNTIRPAFATTLSTHFISTASRLNLNLFPRSKTKQMDELFEPESAIEMHNVL